jgi:hypothetical protein
MIPHHVTDKGPEVPAVSAMRTHFLLWEAVWY